ncbi:secretin receptor-like [Physella acuta]|uniref:secretin receptor-like n=1 Tax=Physella acuta TaxID=109671 RepID=UPI0027DE7C37|nr:secretin receptor-like [Physella acuta]
MSSSDYLVRVVSVMSPLEQRRLIMLAKQNCFKLGLSRENDSSKDGGVCRVTWDDMLCWDVTPAGRTVSQPCPNYVNGFNKNEFATKTCTENGTWWVNPDPVLNREWTNYSDCVKPSIDLSFHAAHGDKIRLLYTIGYSISLGALVVAVVIMLCCKRLHSKSNTLHINLFLTFILRAVISFLKDILFVGNVGLEKDVRRGADGILEFLHDASHWECKLVISVFMYSVNACNMWIFAEALYLTMLVYKPLTTERRGVRLYILLGWSLSFVFIVPWVLVKALYENTFCWNIQHNPDYYWILRGSGVGVVVINFFLFLNIFRKLFLKLRHSSHLGASGKAKYRKLAKFILVLIPLFGIMYIVFYVAIPSNFEESDFNVAYLYLEMGYNSFQGFLLALLFCFLNEEVHGELRRAWHRHRSRRTEMSAMNKSCNHFHSSYRRSHSTVLGNSVAKPCPTGRHKDSHRKELYRLRTMSVSSDTANDISRTTANDISRTTANDISRTTAKDISRTTANDISRTTANDISRTTANDISRTTANDISRTTANDISRTTANDISRTTANDISRTTANDISRTTANDISRTTANDISRTTANDISRTTANDVSRTTANDISRTTANSCSFKIPPRISSADEDILSAVSASLSQPSANLKTTSLLKQAVRTQHWQAGRAGESTHSQHLAPGSGDNTGGQCRYCEL